MIATALALALAVAVAPFGGVAGAEPVVGPVITAGIFLDGVAVDESLHRIYVSDQEVSELLAIDGSTNAVAGTLDLPPRSGQYEMAADPQTHRVYVTTNTSLIAVDGPSMKIVADLGGGADLIEPSTMPSTGRIYALKTVETTNGVRVQLVVFSQTAVITTLDLGTALTTVDPRLTVDTAANKIYVTATSAGTTIIDGATNGTTVISQSGDGPTATDPVLHRLYIVDPQAAALKVVDPAANTLMATVPLGPPPPANDLPYIGRVAVDPRLRIAYVSGGVLNGTPRSDVISVVDLVGNKVTSVLDVNGVVAVDTLSSRGYAAALGSNRVTVLLGDTLPPATTVTSAPTTVADGTAATIRFTGSDNVTSPSSLTFSCSLDGGAFSTCTSPATFTLPPGSHRLSIRSADQAGNVEPTPAVASFTVAGPPAPTTTVGPGATAALGRAPGATVGATGTNPASGTVTTSAVSGPSASTSSTTSTTEPPSATAAAAPPLSPATPSPGTVTLSQLTVVTRSGAVSGPPGVGLRVAGTGFSRSICKRVYVFLDGDRLGSTTPSADGRFALANLSVPGASSSGAHDVVASCDSSGTPAAATGLFTITHRSSHRSQLVSSMHLPSQVPFSGRDLALGALAAAALVLLVAFPAQVFDNTLTENYDEVRGWFRWASPLARPFARMSSGRAAAILLGIAALIFGMADPGFGPNRASLYQFIGLLLSLLVIGIVFSLPTLLYMRRRHRDRGTLSILPAGLVVAALCVLASRVLHFQPGYLYGLIVGLGFSQTLAPDEDGRVSAGSTAVMLAVGVLSWLAWAALQPAATGDHPIAPVLIAETALAAVAVAGVETAVVSLLPIRFMAGAKVAAWSRTVWALLLGVSLLAFIQIFLRPGSGYVSKSATASWVAVVVLLLTVGSGSFIFWAYFRFRRAPAPPSGGAGATAASMADADSAAQSATA